MTTNIIRRSCRKAARALLERGELPVPLIRKNEGGWKPQRQWANADPDECRAWVQDPNVYWTGLAVVTTGLVWYLKKQQVVRQDGTIDRG